MYKLDLVVSIQTVLEVLYSDKSRNGWLSKSEAVGLRS